MDTRTVSSLWLWWLKRLWVFTKKSLRVLLFSFLWGKSLGMELLGPMVSVGDGNGNPLQCSCLGNPRDWDGLMGWWAAVYGVAQSQTRLKRLSSSSVREREKERERERVCVFSCFSHVRLFATPWSPTTSPRPPSSSVHGVFPARILEWVAMPFSRGSSQPREWTQFSCIAGRFFTTESPRKLPKVSMCLTSKETGSCFPNYLLHFTFSTEEHRSSTGPTDLPALGITGLLNFNCAS